MRCPRFQRAAFTLLELVLVLAVLATLMAMVAPSLRGWNKGSKLRDATDQLIAATRHARSQAVHTAEVHRLEADPSGTAFRVVAVGPEGDDSAAPAASEFEHEVRLSPSLRIDIQRLDGGIGGVEFYPNGRVTPAVIRLYAEWGEVTELAATTPADSFRLVPAGGMR